MFIDMLELSLEIHNCILSIGIHCIHATHDFGQTCLLPQLNVTQQMLKTACRSVQMSLISVVCCQEEEQLFEFHMANLENACGATLKHVSAFHWDHNEAFAQFGGPLCVLPRGLAMLMDHLAKDINIRLNSQVDHPTS